MDVHIVDPGFAADGIYRATRTGKMRIDVMMGGEHVFTEACTGKRGWEWKGKGEAVDCSAAATAALRHEQCDVSIAFRPTGRHGIRR